MNRSQLMARIKSRGNASTELALARALRREGVTGWRRQLKVLGMRPDFVFRKTKIAVFTDGCFWHACEDHSGIDRLSHRWQCKLMQNVIRDGRQGVALQRAGWKVVRIWEHTLREKNYNELLPIVEQLGRGAPLGMARGKRRSDNLSLRGLRGDNGAAHRYKRRLK